MGIPLLRVETRWSCPNCVATHLTTIAQPHTPFHPCRGLAGILSPYVIDGTRCKIEALPREDYVNGELGLRYNAGGTPIMAVKTERWDDSYDSAVFAPTATAGTREG